MFPVKLQFFNNSKFPRRSKAEWRLIDKNPFGDTDRDRVPNWFDCKPLNRKKQGFEYQGSHNENEKELRTVKMPPNMFLETTYVDVQRSIEKIKERDKDNPPKIPYQYDGSTYEEYKKDFARKRKKISEIAAEIKSKEKNLPMPYLEFNEEGLNIGHEGRHRAVAAMKAKLKYMPVLMEIPKGSKFSPEYEKLKPIKGKQYTDYDEIVDDDYKIAKKKTAIYVEDLQDENDNQIPDKAEDVEIKPIEIKDED